MEDAKRVLISIMITVSVLTAVVGVSILLWYQISRGFSWFFFHFFKRKTTWKEDDWIPCFGCAKLVNVLDKDGLCVMCFLKKEKLEKGKSDSAAGEKQ
jgi:hypothetical protein